MTSDEMALGGGRLSWIELFLGTLLAPVETFDRIGRSCRERLAYVPGTFMLVLAVAAVDAFRVMPSSAGKWISAAMAAEMFIFSAVWLAGFALIALMAVCFNADGRKIRALLITLGWSMAPWIFMAPLSCLKGLLGPAHVLLLSLPLTWIFFLQLVAINQSLGLRAWQTLCLALVIPVLFAFLQCLQFLQGVLVVLGAL